MVVANSQFSGNQGWQGGALAVTQARFLSVYNSNFSNNYFDSSSSNALTSNGGGGAIFMLDVPYTYIANSSYTNNSAQSGGAL